VVCSWIQRESVEELPDGLFVLVHVSVRDADVRPGPYQIRSQLQSLAVDAQSFFRSHVVGQSGSKLVPEVVVGRVLSDRSAEVISSSFVVSLSELDDSEAHENIYVTRVLSVCLMEQSSEFVL